MKRIVFILLAWSVISTSLFAQTQKIVSYPKFISNSLIIFSKYVNWPQNHKSGDFIITIVGNQEIFNELTANVSNMTVGAQSVVVKYCKRASDLSGYSHIVFLAENNSVYIRKAVEMIGAENTLLVTSDDGLLSSGSGINFVEVDGLMKFEISKSNIQKRNLEIHSWLEKMATKV
jgi:hypothetical protein